MITLRVWLTRVWGLFRRSGRDQALNDEIAGHLDDLTDDLVDAGMSPAEAAAEARRRFGGVDQVKEAYRDQRGWSAVDGLRQDVVLGLRRLRTQPGSTALAVICLGLGIGVSMAFFMIVNAICIRGLPIDEPNRVLFLGTVDREGRQAGVSYAEFLDIRRDMPAFAGVAAYSSAPFNIADDREAAERVSGSYVSAAAFRLLGVTPHIGREFQPDDEIAGAPTVAVIGHDVWLRRYHGDVAAVGRTVRINGTPAVIVGVMPEGFRFPGVASAWLPLSTVPDVTRQPRDSRTWSAFGRLSDEITSAGAREALSALAHRLEASHPATNRNVRFTSVPINDRFTGRVTEPVWLAFMTAGFLVLLVACANVANVLLAQLADRSREVAMRLAIGATRLRIVRQLLVESGILATLAGAAGLLLSLAAVRLLAASVPASAPLPYWITFSVDGRVLGTLIAVCMLSVVLFGLVPALQGSRVSVNDLLKAGGRHGTTGGRAHGWSATFMVIQFALALVLVANVSMDRDARSQGTGVAIDPKPLLTAQIAFPPTTYESPEDRRRFLDQLAEDFGRAEGVSAMSVATQLPPQAGVPMRILRPDQTLTAGEQGETVFAASVGARYFETLGVSLIAGRDLSTDDDVQGREGVVINEHLADRLFAGAPAVGERLAVVGDREADSEPIWRTVVGVAPNIVRGLLTRPMIYVASGNNPPASPLLIVRSSMTAQGLSPRLRRTVLTLDPDLPVYRAVPLEIAQYESNWNGRISSNILGSTTIIALLLALVGLAAATAHAAAQRSRELAIRVALGATRINVSGLILRRAAMHVGIGLGAGVVLTWLYSRAFVPPGAPSLTDANILLPALGLVAVVALIASAVPALRASRVPPLRRLGMQ